MIDIENQVYTKISTALTTKYGDNVINLTSVYQNIPPKFPSVSVIQEDNSIDRKGTDSNNFEYQDDLLFEVNVYVNNIASKKALCKEIFAIVSDSFVELGFERTLARPIPNEDESIYRMIGRFVAKVDKNLKISRR